MADSKFVLVSIATGLLLVFAHSQATADSSKFIVIGVAGFSTKKENPENLESNLLSRRGHDSGAWSLPLPRNSHRIEKTLFLTHHRINGEMRQILQLFSKGEQGCNPDLGLILVGNSWGSAKTQRIAAAYADHCGKPADLVIITDGILKPLMIPFSRPIVAETCINFYQVISRLNGTEIEGCENILVDESAVALNGNFAAHFHIGWRTPRYVRELIQSYLVAGSIGLRQTLELNRARYSSKWD